MSRDPDKEYLSGCLLSGTSSLVVLIIPIILCNIVGRQTHEINTNAGLTKIFLISIGLAAAFTLPIVRRFGIAPAFGALGGFACGAAYWFLNLQQTIAKAPAETLQPTEYQDSTMFLVPLAWFTIGAIASLLPLYKNNRLNSKES
jgi:hypothetical protein